MAQSKKAIFLAENVGKDDTNAIEVYIYYNKDRKVYRCAITPTEVIDRGDYKTLRTMLFNNGGVTFPIEQVSRFNQKSFDAISLYSIAIRDQVERVAENVGLILKRTEKGELVEY